MNYRVQLISILSLLLPSTLATTVDILNRCSYTVWAAAVPGGGRRLNTGQSWRINLNSVTGRIWGRTGCSFDGSGRGICQTGDCGGVLACTSNGRPPSTIAEYAFSQFNGLDFYDISLVNGFNVSIEVSPTSGSCRSSRCAGDITTQCPPELRAPGGCDSPCNAFKTDQYCCRSSSNCSPTNYSRFFKNRCPDAYSYPMDDAASTFTCPTGTNYRVIFCPTQQPTARFLVSIQVIRLPLQ